MKEQDAAKGPSRRAARQKLEALQRAGVTHLPRRASAARAAQPAKGSSATPAKKPTAPAISVAPAAPAAPKTTPAASAATTPSAPQSVANAPLGERNAALEIIRKEVMACGRCDELCRTRTQTVFGVGNVYPRLVFMGEAPGADEDLQGEPFVGRAGQLLNKILEACTLKREEVYILNVLKCRPPGNRTPSNTEVENCREFFERQLEILKPEFICCLGTVAAQALLQTTESIGRLRGKFHDYKGVPVMCVYHPSYLLRNPSAKKIVWEDLKLLLARMGIDPSARAATKSS